ncbi:DNA cytosine methyltransferase [Comamonas sp. CMM02]|uniref:DNA cytosine methyltransferase n=1 Tax=Comamonas sp. CMM02 TaxID=2769307 RepID=UPI001786167C|nr:DNA cytosine methyltransferase [Comamonas sp. CMM02]MBD9402087.1 DNA cytosine methyltransferase [Comamonas sp. CMM02]
MLTPQFVLPVHNELVVDLFAGGGGASTGMELAIGRHVDIAVNHDREAISLHTANHPQTRHFCSDVFEVDPLDVTDGQPVGLLWASPDCKHFSKAKGGKPVSKKIRGLAWVVVEWVKALLPTDTHSKLILLENVEEFQTWGPLGADDRPCPERKGQTFQLWVQELRNLGYKVEWKELRACDFGAPTIRKRLFLVARRDGLPIVWPKPTHAKPDAKGKVPAGMKPWRTAADCIDCSIPAPSIFERSKPLADATCRRIAKGIVRFVMEAEKPFIVPGVAATLIQTGYGERPGQSPRVPGLDKPLGTVVAGQKHAVVQAFLAKHYTGVVGTELEQPAGTVTTVDHHSLVTAHLTKFRVGSVGTAVDEPVHTVTAGGTPKRPSTGNTMGLVTTNLIHMGHGEGKDGTKRWSHGIRDVVDPLNTITAQGAAAGIVTSHMIKLRNNQFGQSHEDPVPTLTAGGGHAGEVRAFLVKYYGSDKDGQELPDPLHTIPARDRFRLVMVHGEPYAIVDIGLRMLTPRELFRAQGFPDSYQIETGAAGESITKTAQVRMCGNSVCPPLSHALVAANYSERQALRRAA